MDFKIVNTTTTTLPSNPMPLFRSTMNYLAEDSSPVSYLANSSIPVIFSSFTNFYLAVQNSHVVLRVDFPLFTVHWIVLSLNTSSTDYVFLTLGNHCLYPNWNNLTPWKLHFWLVYVRSGACFADLSFLKMQWNIIKSISPQTTP